MKFQGKVLNNKNENLVSTTCVITVFSITRPTLTLFFFCPGGEIIKFVLVNALSRVTTFASSLLAMETRWSVFLGTKYICIISKQQRLSQARD